MIWEILQCLGLQSLIETAAALSLNLSSAILLAYALTFRKTLILGASFLLSEIWGYTNGFFSLDYLIPRLSENSQIIFGASEFSYRALYGWSFFLGYLFIFSIASVSHILLRKKRGTSSVIVNVWCVTMILFIFAMAQDSLVNEDIETYIWRNYEGIVFCIHICIILSHYKPRAIIGRITDKLNNLLSKCGGFCRN